MTIDNLSNELLLEIFEYLHTENSHQRDLCACLCVSPRWHHLALPIVWRNLHLDSNWQMLYNGRKGQDGNRVTDGSYPDNKCNPFRVTPLHLEQFSRCLELHQSRLLDPLQWCRTLSLRFETFDGRVTTENALEIITILFRTRNIGQLMICLHIDDPEPCDAFSLVWGLITRDLSYRKQLKLELVLEFSNDELLPYNYPFVRLREILTSLTVETIWPLLDCLPPGELSQFKHLESLKVLPFELNNTYSSRENYLFWKEVENLPLKFLEVTSPCPALKWYHYGRPNLPTSIRILNVNYNELDFFLRNPMDFVRQLPNLRSLRLTSFYELGGSDAEPADDPEIDHFPDGSPRCFLCQSHVSTIYQLRDLNLSIKCGDATFRALILATPLLESLAIYNRVTNDDVVFIVTHCKSLKEVGFECEDVEYDGIECDDIKKIKLNCSGFVFFCKMKTLTKIFLNTYQWHSVQRVLEHWVMHLPLLKRAYCGRYISTGYGFHDLVHQWKGGSITMGDFLAEYGETKLCCLEEEARGISFPETPKWTHANTGEMADWIRRSVKYDEDRRENYLDMEVLRSDLMNDRD